MVTSRAGRSWASCARADDDAELVTKGENLDPERGVLHLAENEAVAQGPDEGIEEAQEHGWEIMTGRPG